MSHIRRLQPMRSGIRDEKADRRSLQQPLKQNHYPTQMILHRILEAGDRNIAIVRGRHKGLNASSVDRRQ